MTRITHYVYVCVTNWIYVPERRASAQQGSKRCRCAVWRWRASLIVLTASLIQILKYQLSLQYMMERADFSEFLWCRCSVWRCRASLMSPTASPWKFSKISSLFSKLRGELTFKFFWLLKIIKRKLWSMAIQSRHRANLILLTAISTSGNVTFLLYTRVADLRDDFTNSADWKWPFRISLCVVNQKSLYKF